jgi:hypothetical protein
MRELAPPRLVITLYPIADKEGLNFDGGWKMKDV